jgi:hypothetical protein
MADQAVFAENRPQIGGFVGVAAIDGRNPWRSEIKRRVPCAAVGLSITIQRFSIQHDFTNTLRCIADIDIPALRYFTSDRFIVKLDE